MKRGVVAILTFTLSPLAGWTAGAWHAAMSTRHTAHRAPISAPAPAETTPASSAPAPGHIDWSDLGDPTSSGPAEQEDIYGNEVAPAIATYKPDASGGVYEEHSPQTEVAKLKAPIS